MAPTGLEDAYLELCKRCLSGSPTFRAPEARLHSLRWRVYQPLLRVLDRQGLALVKKVDPGAHEEGRDYTTGALSMIGRRRLDNLQACVVDVIRSGVPGDLIETGVWRGGAVILMRAVLWAYGDTERVVWAADSFQGLPRPDADKYPADAKANLWQMQGLAVSLDAVKANIAGFGLLDDQVRFLPGWFRDTLAAAPIERLAVLRLDGDMYESTIYALTALYDKVSPGGYVIVDDYGAFQECRSAIDDFRRDRGITDEITKVDWTGVYWKKGPQPA